MAMTKIRTVGSLLLSVLVIAALLVPEDALAKKKGKGTGKGKKTALVEESSPQEKAREHYSKGKAAYETGDFETALAEFSEAYKTKAHPTVLKSIAECQVQLGEMTTAVETFENYLADPEAEDRESIQARLDELKSTPSDVAVSSAPEGASFSVAGDDVTGVAPATLQLPPGEHLVTFVLEGYEPLEKSVTVVLGENSELLADFLTEGQPVAAAGGALVDPYAEEDVSGEKGEKKEERSGPPVAFWACAAVTGVGLVMGTVFGTMALDDEKKFEDDPTDETKKAGERNAIIADVSFGVAGAAAIAGIIVFVVDRKKQKRGSQEKASVLVTPVADQNQIGLRAQVSF